MIDKSKIEKANEIYRKAVMDLGPELGGWGVADLLADNTDWPLSEIYILIPELDHWSKILAAGPLVEPCKECGSSRDHNPGCPFLAREELAWLGIRMVCLAPNCGGEFRAAIDTDLSDPECAVWCPFCGTDEVEEAR